MATHGATITWQRGEDTFLDNRYSRAHLWRFDGGLEVPASSSPHVVRVPFFNLAALGGLRVDSYADAAKGAMAKNSDGKEWVATVILKPHVVFSGPKAPDEAAVEALHHDAHANCFLANSVRSAVETHGSWDYRPA